MPLKKSTKLKKPSCTIFLMKIVYGPFYRGWPSLDFCTKSDIFLTRQRHFLVCQRLFPACQRFLSRANDFFLKFWYFFHFSACFRLFVKKSPLSDFDFLLLLFKSILIPFLAYEENSIG